MAISPEKFKQIIAKTSKQFAEENRSSSSYRPSMEMNENMYNSQPDLDYSPLDGSEEYISEGFEPMTNSSRIDPSLAATSKLPAAIKQSMLSEQIDVSSVDPNHSIIDDIAKSMPMQRPRRQVSEQTYQMQNGPGIDYSLIKTIVNECIESKLSEMKKEVLSEGTLQTIGLSGGKIKLVDNKGNVYTAALKKQGNINQ